MNTPNNKREKASQEKIEKVFVTLIQTKELKEVSVTDICKQANVNRSTFYANYIDIYDLADKIREKLELEIKLLYQEERESKRNSNDFLKIFKYIKDNQIFFRTYFKLGMDEVSIFREYDNHLSELLYNNNHVDYHIEFFKAGFNAMIKKWLFAGCPESPEEMERILKEEYKNKDLSGCF